MEMIMNTCPNGIIWLLIASCKYIFCICVIEMSKYEQSCQRMKRWWLLQNTVSSASSNIEVDQLTGHVCTVGAQNL